MTKLKNTKKGMAKKALSISLVAAMLATSNVPVWAADFSDGEQQFAPKVEAEAPIVEETPEVEVFSEEAPTEETESAPVTSASVLEGHELILDDVKVSDKATFATGKVNVSGKIYYKKTGDTEATELKDYNFGWRIKGQKAAIFTDAIASDNDSSKMAFTPDFVGNTANSHSQAKTIDWSEYVGRTLELYIYNNEDSNDAIKIDPTVIGETVINKCDMTGASLRLSKTSQALVYNGKIFQYTNEDGDANDVSINNDGSAAFTNIPAAGDQNPGTQEWTRENILKYFKVSAAETALNAGDKIVVTATAKEDSPYAGTIYAETLEVQQREFDADEFVLSVEEGLSYQYTGNHIIIPNNKVTLKENDSLAEADLSAAIVKAETTTSAIGMRSVTVTLDAKQMPNFKQVDSTMQTSKETVNIVKRDLKADSTSISIKHGRVAAGTTKAKFVSDYLTLKDKNGTALNLQEGTGKDYILTIKNLGSGTVVDEFNLTSGKSYEITISAYEKDSTAKDSTCVNAQTIGVEVAGNVIAETKTSKTYAPYYTGEAIKPSKADFGSLTIVNADNTIKDETLSDEDWEIVDYESNQDASLYVKGKASTYAYAVVKIGGTSTYAGQTCKIPFEIKPLTVSPDSVTVPKTITYNKGYGPAKDYNVQLVVTGKDKSGKIVKGLSTSDYTVDYEYVDGTNNAEAKNELHDFIKATITIKNTNFMGENGATKVIEMPDETKYTEIVEKALTSSMIQFTPDSYTYTGGNITPDYVVLDGVYLLYEDEDYKEVSITNNLNVGKGKVTISGIDGHYYGTASSEFNITAANTSDVKVEFTNPNKECLYTGKQVRPRSFKVTLNGNDVSSQFEIVSYGENITGKGTVVLKPVDGNKNFTGSNITAEFDIIKEVVSGTLDLYNTNGEKVTDKYKIEDPTATINNFAKESFEFDGTAKTFAEEKLTLVTAGTKAKISDFDIKYVDNVSGSSSKISSGANTKFNVAYVYAVAKEGTGYTGSDQIVTADGSIIKGVVAKIPFAIKNVYFNQQNVSVKNAVYAGGLPVKPEVLVQIKGITLVEGKDYELTLDGAAKGDNYNNVTDGKVYGLAVKGIGGYTGSTVSSDDFASLKWGIDKKNLNDCEVKVTNGVVTVMNGYIPVPVTEYTYVENADKTYTVTANTTSKSYTGSKTVVAEGQKPEDKPATPVIQQVKVVGNKATVVLSGDCEGATGYDYVISTNGISSDPNRLVNKNILSTQTTYNYLQQGVYYAHCHAWKRVDGKKVFSDYSTAYPFVVSSITPDQPGVTSVKVTGSTVKVTYTKSANATGYDIVLGSAVKSVNGEKRPVEYGKLVKKVTSGNTVTATFKNVPKGTYYAGLHAYNRTSENGKKVFSPWSNTKKVTVK